jgi:hypothetical protein
VSQASSERMSGDFQTRRPALICAAACASRAAWAR